MIPGMVNAPGKLGFGEQMFLNKPFRNYENAEDIIWYCLGLIRAFLIAVVPRIGY